MPGCQRLMEDSEASLPKSTLLKLVRELLPTDVKVASDTQELIVRCSNEFVQLLATQANEVSISDWITSLARVPAKFGGSAEPCIFDIMPSRLCKRCQRIRNTSNG